MYRPILVVEDYDLDFEAAARGFRRLGLAHPIVRASGAGEAIRWLRTDTPSLVLLDLDLPDSGGEDVIDEMKGSVTLQHVPVVIWSATEQKERISEVYRRGATTFVPKRMSPAEQRRDLENIARFWFESARLPHEAA